MTAEEAYEKGFRDGLECFAWWKDGTIYVGTAGKTLGWALENVKTLWNYLPPERK